MHMDMRGVWSLHGGWGGEPIVCVCALRAMCSGVASWEDKQAWYWSRSWGVCSLLETFLGGLRSGGAERTAPPPHVSACGVWAAGCQPLTNNLRVHHYVIKYPGRSATKAYLNQSLVSLLEDIIHLKVATLQYKYLPVKVLHLKSKVRSTIGNVESKTATACCVAGQQHCIRFNEMVLCLKA